MVRGSEEECDAGLLQAAPRRIGRQLNAGPERRQHVGAAALAGDSAVAVLGDGHSRRRSDEHRARGNVERVRHVRTRADDVEHDTGKSCPVNVRVNGACAQLLRKRSDFLRRLALLSERDEKLRLRVVAEPFIEQRAHSLADLLCRESGAGGKFVCQPAELGHTSAHGSTNYLGRTDARECVSCCYECFAFVARHARRGRAVVREPLGRHGL